MTSANDPKRVGEFVVDAIPKQIVLEELLATSPTAPTRFFSFATQSFEQLLVVVSLLVPRRFSSPAKLSFGDSIDAILLRLSFSCLGKSQVEFSAAKGLRIVFEFVVDQILPRVVSTATNSCESETTLSIVPNTPTEVGESKEELSESELITFTFFQPQPA